MNQFKRGMSSLQEDGDSINAEIGRVLVRYSKAQRRALKQLALDVEKPMETLMHEALALLLRHYGRDVPPSPRQDADENM